MFRHCRLPCRVIGLLAVTIIPFAQAQACDTASVAQVPELGLAVTDIPNPALDERRIRYGVAIIGVTDDGAAARSGVDTGDVIYELNGLPVYSTDRLQWLIGHSTATAAYQLSVLRGNEHLEFEIAPRAR